MRARCYVVVTLGKLLEKYDYKLLMEHIKHKTYTHETKKRIILPISGHFGEWLVHNRVLPQLGITFEEFEQVYESLRHIPESNI